MTVKTKEKPRTKVVTKKETSEKLMERTICSLTDVVAELKRDVARIKIRLGI